MISFRSKQNTLPITWGFTSPILSFGTISVVTVNSLRSGPSFSKSPNSFSWAEYKSRIEYYGAWVLFLLNIFIWNICWWNKYLVTCNHPRRKISFIFLISALCWFLLKLHCYKRLEKVCGVYFDCLRNEINYRLFDQSQ